MRISIGIIPVIFTSILLITCLSSYTRSDYSVPETAGISHYFHITEYKSTDLPEAYLLILDPIFFNANALDQVAAYFANEGYHVLVLEIQDPGPPVTIPDTSQLIGAIEMLKRKNPDLPVYAMGTSLGGLGWVPLIQQKNSGLNGLIFLGTGIDYNYPGSFHEKLAGYRQEGSSLRKLCMEPGNCPNFIRPDLFSKGIRLEDLPMRPENLTEKYILNYFQNPQIPVAFVTGKIDGISPEESVYPAIKKIGLDRVSVFAKDQYFYLEASGANGMSADYDHFDLFVSEKAADEIYKELEEWMNGRRAQK